MRFERRYTQAGKSPFEGMAFRAADFEIRNPDGSIVFQLKGVDVPAEWSQVAADVLAQKYFRRAGVPARLHQIAEPDVPEWLWRSAPDEAALALLPQAALTAASRAPARSSIAWPAPGPTGAGRAATSTARKTPAPSTTSTATCWRRRSARPTRRSGSTPACTGPTASTVRARATGSSTTATASLTAPSSAYERPQPHACFIQSVSDDLVNEGGIMDLWVREARLFKYGSGTGSNFSRAARRGRAAVRRRQVVGPDVASSRSATARRAPSSRAARRAARPRWSSVDIDHPDIEDFIAWKMLEEQKVAALVAGSRLANRHLNAVMRACLDGDVAATRLRSRSRIQSCAARSCAARQAELPENYIQRVIQFARQGYRHIEFPAFDTDWESEAYLTVSGQNANNSVRVTDDVPAGGRSRPRVGR